MVGRELGDRAYEILTGEVLPPPPPPPISSTATHGQDQEPDAFDFTHQMRTTRLTVDRMLDEGQVVEAERYMEEQRRMFVDNGYYIRKLNQAYFAFHGTYAESPSSSSPIGSQMRRYRDNMPDLATFIIRMERISSYQEFLDEIRELDQIAAER